MSKPKRSQRPTFFFSPGTWRHEPDGTTVTRVTLTMDHEEATALVRRLFDAIQGDDTIQIDLPLGRGEWTDPRIGFGENYLRFPKVKRCPGSGQELVASEYDREGKVSRCGLERVARRPRAGGT